MEKQRGEKKFTSDKDRSVSGRIAQVLVWKVPDGLELDMTTSETGLRHIRLRSWDSDNIEKRISQSKTILAAVLPFSDD
ncbi:MAG: hypothetical protein K2W78_12345 [Xanthobacteraceae bacterium]|nr:hypothetical protein [Xanthobacteraceae bacterium]